jgi:hypothetical protein
VATHFKKRRKVVSATKMKAEVCSSDDDVFLQPWFLPKDVSLQIRSILPHIHLTKMRYYFDDYGCLRCESRNILYGSNGLCENCAPLIRKRVSESLKRRLKSVGLSESDRTVESLSDCVTAARHIIERSRAEHITPSAREYWRHRLGAE